MTIFMAYNLAHLKKINVYFFYIYKSTKPKLSLNENAIHHHRLELAKAKERKNPILGKG